MQRTLLFVLALSCTLSCYAQKTYPWEHDLSELHQTEDFQNVAFEDDYDELEEIAEHPFNINTASREQLERLPFLTSRQIEDIQAYVYQYKGMKSLGELAMIESLDYEQLQLLPYFVYAGPDTPGKFPSLQEI
ncbi:MAG: helix-hairpin-helix domain-containing protein, partial [Prevotella sp.]